MKKKILSLALILMLGIMLLPNAARAAEVTVTILSHVTGNLEAEILAEGISGDDVITGLIVSGGTINNVDRDFLYTGLHQTLKTVNFSGASLDYTGLTVFPATNPDELPSYAFGQWSALTSIVLPDDLTVIVNRAFNNCTSLESLTLPIGLTKIGALAFDSCSKLKDLYISSPTPPPIPSASYFSFADVVAHGAAIHVPAGSENAWDQGDSDSHHDADRKWCGLFIENMVPVITSPYSTRTSETTAEFRGSSDEPGTCYYASVKDGGAEIPVDTSGVGVVIDSNYGNYTARLYITGLEPGAYDIYVKVKDLRGNVSEVVKIDLEDYVFPVDVIINNHETGKLGDEIAAALSSLGIPDRNDKVQSLKVASGSLDSNDWAVFNDRYEMADAIGSIDLAGTSSLSIPDSALDCYSMAVISLPAGIESIGEYAFEDCTSLTDITLLSLTPPTVGTDAFYGIVPTAVVHVPVGSAAAYKAVADGDTTDNLWYGLTIEEIGPATYTVTFNSNGALYIAKTVLAGTAIDSGNWPSNPARSGYRFKGWNTQADGNGTEFATDTAVTGNLTIYAQWTKKSSSGTKSGSESKPVSPQPATKTQSISAANGGTVSREGVMVTIPAGTLPQDAIISITKLTEVQTGNTVPAGLQVKLGSEIYEIKTSGERNFGDNTLTIQIPYDPAKIGSDELPVIHYRDETTGEWLELTTALEQDETSGQWFAVTKVNHLTKFAVFSTKKKQVTLFVGQQGATIDGKAYLLDAVPYLDSQANRTLVPLRFISEALGAEVDWNPGLRQLTVSDNGKILLLTLDSATVYINGQEATIDCAPVSLPPGRTFVPLRFIGENLGAAVEYNAVTKSIRIIR